MNNKRIDIMIVGAEKSGTTAMLSLLASHPKISAQNQVECPYFLKDEEFEQGQDWMLGEYFPGKHDKKILVGKHVGLFNSKVGLERLVEKNQNVLIVTLVRNPVKRAYSSYWYKKVKGKETSTTFEAAIENTLHNFESETGVGFGYISKGCYMRHIKLVNSLVGKRRHIILVAEEFFLEPIKSAELILNKQGLSSELLDSEKMWQNEGGGVRFPLINKLLFTSLEWLPPPIIMMFQKIIGVAKFRKLKYVILKLNHKRFVHPKMSVETKNNLTKYFEKENAGLASFVESKSSWVKGCGKIK